MTAKRKVFLSCLNCQHALTVFTSSPLSSELRRYYLACRQCSQTYTCLVYPKTFIRKGNNVAPPDEKLQPDLCKHRTRLLDVIKKGSEFTSKNIGTATMIFNQ